MIPRTGIVPTMGALEWTLLIILSIFWGGSFFFIKVVLMEIGPLTLVTARVGLAALALFAYLRWRGHRLPTDAATWTALLVMGVINNAVPFTLISLSQTRIDSSLAAILNATAPLFTVVLAHFLTRDEKLTPLRALGVVIGIGGVIVLIGPAALGGLGLVGFGLVGLGDDALAQLGILGATFSYALAGIFGRRFRAMPPAVAAFGMTASATVMMVPVAALIEQPWSLAPPGPITIAALIGLAMVSTAAGYILYFRILATAGATNLLLVTFLLPVSALFLGMVVLGERPAGMAFLGMGLIFLGLAAIDGRLVRRMRVARV